MPEEPTDVQKAKLLAETKKLEAETRELNRNPMLKPSFWFSIVPAAVGIVGVGMQYFASSLDYKKAEVLRQQAILDTKQAEQDRKEIDKEVKSKQATLNELTANIAKMNELRAAKDQEVKVLLETVANLKDAKMDKAQQLQKLEESVSKLNTQQKQSSMLSAAQSKIVTNLTRNKE